MSAEQKETILLGGKADSIPHAGDILSGQGFHIVRAGSFQETMEILESGLSVNLILFDASLVENLSARESFHAFADSHDIPLLFLVFRDEDLERTREMPFCGFIDGSSSDAVFLAQVHSVLYRRAGEKRKYSGEVLRYRRLCDELPVAMCTFLPDSTLTYINQTYADFFHIPSKDLLGRRFFDLISPKDRQDLVGFFPTVSSQTPTKAHVVHKTTGGDDLWYKWIVTAFFGDGGELEYMQSVGLDITERVRAEEQIKKRLRYESGLGRFSRELLFGLSSEGDSVTTALGYIRDATDADRVYIFQNFNDERDGLCMRQLFESVKDGVSAQLDNPELSQVPYEPYFKRWYDSLIQDIPITGQTSSFPKQEQEILKSQGILSILVLPIKVNEEWYGFIGLDDVLTARVWDVNDIKILKVASEIFSSYLKEKRSEARVKALLEEKELILREVHHRIKNNMITVHSLLSLQARNMKDPAAASALEDASNRVLSMMVLYSRLYQSNDFSRVSVDAYLPDLVRQIMRGFPNCGLIRIETDIDAFSLETKEVISVGIILNELITNIMKYAFDSGTEGTVRISSWQREGRTTLIVEDNGRGMPESVDILNSPGFGLKLVGMLAAQLSGSIRVERGKGTKTILEFSA